MGRRVMDGEFASHAMFGQMSETERMRYAYLHLDHHLRGGGFWPDEILAGLDTL